MSAARSEQSGAVSARRLAIPRGPTVVLTVDGEPMRAHTGEMLASVLLVEGVRAFRRTADGRPRSVFCAMGSCLDCAVRVNGVALVRSCLTPVEEGMDVQTGESW